MSSYGSRDLFAQLRRQVRLLMLLDAAKVAGLSPVPVRHLHSFAYLSNVLAPVWHVPIFDGKLLKRQAGAFYPALQEDLDRLVGMGMVYISSIGHSAAAGSWRLEGSYDLNMELAAPSLEEIKTDSDNVRLLEFLVELGFALSALPSRDLEQILSEDATFADPLVDDEDVVDFAQWKRVNNAANAAEYFENLIPGGGRATAGEKIHLYVRHLRWRLNASR